MGTEEREPDADLSTPEGDLSAKLRRFEVNATRFSFYRLIYMLERVSKGAPRLGHTGPARDERIRIRSDPTLTFASSDVTAFDYKKFPDNEKRIQLTSSFLGLYGSTSPLPGYFAEDIALSVFQHGTHPVREFLDVIHHRLFSLVYRAWSKYRLSVGYLSEGKDEFTRRMFCAVGLDGFSEARTPLHPFYFLRFAPILASKSRSARGLSVVLDELLGNIGVDIEQFVGHWTLIEKTAAQQTRRRQSSAGRVAGHRALRVRRQRPIHAQARTPGIR